MKEITVIIRRQKLSITRKILAIMGFPSMTIASVEGRGKGKGLIQEIDPGIPDAAAADIKLKPTPAIYSLEHSVPRAVQYVPKRMLQIVVPDEVVPQMVEAIIAVNQTGYPGDGKVFVTPLEEAIRVRTGEKGIEAVI